MPVDAKIRDILRMKNLTLPPEARVQSIEVEDYVTYDGEDALRVWVVIDENLTDAELLNGGPTWLRVNREITDALRSAGVDLFPYMTYTKPSERYLVVNEEE